MKKPKLKHLLLWAFTAAALTLGACKTDLSGIESDIDDLKGKVSELENAIDELRSAYDAGKIITSVESIDYAENGGGYLVTFSDGSTIMLRNGENGADGAAGEKGEKGEKGDTGATGDKGDKGDKGNDGVTPMVKIDEDGYWSVSYDGGATYEPLTDSEGNPIFSRGADGAAGEKGDKGDTGEKGDKGDTGEKGDKGDTGEKGDKGDAGEKGDKGDPGEKGDKGDPGEKGDKGDTGEKGDKGDTGAAGAAGICVRVTLGNDGCYVFELYSPDAPETVIESIATPYTSDPSSVLQSVVEDDNTGVITLTLADGRSMSFNLDVTYPTSIVVLTDKVVLPYKGEMQFEFRINPSNARFIPVVGGADTNIQLDLASTRAAESYVTEPENYRIVSVTRSVNANGEVKAGQYTATVEDTGKSAVYDENVVVVLTTKDGRGEQIQLSSSLVEFRSNPEPNLLGIKVGDTEAVEVAEGVFQIKMPYAADVTALKPRYTTNGADIKLKTEQNGMTDASTVDMSSPVTLVAVSDDGRTREYRVAVHYSALPVVYLTTPSPITSKNDWTNDCTIDIWNAGEQSTIYEAVQIKGRGNTTWGYAKKPYAIKLDSKAEVLGMAKHKRWVLLANYLDVTCMRNATAFEIARQLDGLAWTPSGRFVDVVMNGKLVGNYYLCEQIKVDKNRVNIKEITPSDIDEKSVTGGYIFELDTYYDEMYKFKTKYRNLPVQFKDPDEDIADAQFNYVENYFNTVEDILYGGNADTDEVFDYIDLDSYVDWYLVHTLALNGEPGHPKSSYMHKDRGGKLVAGPVWDFDYGTFRSTSSGLTITSAIWYNALFKNDIFVTRLKERWAENKARLATVESFIDETAEQIKESAEGNKTLWPVSGGPNYDGDLSFTEAVAGIKAAYRQRIENVGKAIEAL